MCAVVTECTPLVTDFFKKNCFIFEVHTHSFAKARLINTLAAVCPELLELTETKYIVTSYIFFCCLLEFLILFLEHGQI